MENLGAQLIDSGLVDGRLVIKVGYYQGIHDQEVGGQPNLG